MEGDTPYISFVQAVTCTNEVHFAAYQKAFFFANSYPLWLRTAVSIVTDMVSISKEPTSSTEQNQLNTNVLAIISKWNSRVHNSQNKNRVQCLCPEANPTQSDADSH